MKSIDIRLDAASMDQLKSMIGETLCKYKCDPFIFSNDVYGIAGICTEKSSFAFTNTTQTMDYYGAPEDVAVFRFVPMAEEDIQSKVQDEVMIEIPVLSRIKEINVVNERQKLFENEVQIYEVRLTRGVIFIMEDELEISFEKSVWFSEMITVNRGYKLINHFSHTSEFEENWEGGQRGECTREIVVFS